MVLTVDVVGPAPWGFRIAGGRDFHTPIMVTKVTERSKAEAADLRPGDIIVAINGESAEGMLHAEAQSKIRQSPSPLRLQLDRSRAASPGQTNGESSLEVLATRFQGSVRTHTHSQSSLRSSYSSPASLSPRPGSPFSSPPPSSPQALTGEGVISRSFQSPAHSAVLAADRLSYGRCPRSLEAGRGRAGDSAVLVLPPSPGPRSSSPRLRYQQALVGRDGILRRWGEVEGDRFLGEGCRASSLLSPCWLSSSSQNHFLLGTVFSWPSHPCPNPPGEGPSFLAASCPTPHPHSVDSEGGSHLLEEDSEVFKMLQENREGQVAPRQSSSFRLLQEALEAEERGGTPVFLPSSLSPQSSLATGRAPATPPKLHTCEKCSTSIANQAVRIQDGRYRHPGCYACADCGLNLKMRGHFWVGDELFCEKHARQRYSAPSAVSSQA